MLSEPKPKQELHVEVKLGVPIIDLYAYSQDAMAFCERLKKYGHFDCHVKEDNFKQYTLIVYPSFDFKQVVEYIQSYNS